MPNDPNGAAAEGLPVVQSTAEDPHDRARRLMHELSSCLDDCFGGRWGADVYPARLRSTVATSGFFNLRSQLGAWHRGRRARTYLARLRQMTPDERVEHHFSRLRRALFLQEMVR